jgi:hypothetical protein
MSKNTTSKVDGMHFYLNDITITLFMALMVVFTLGAGYLIYQSNQRANTERARTFCPQAGQDLGLAYRLVEEHCEVQAATGRWIRLAVPKDGQ